MTTLYLFTGSYPYSAAAENTFLPQELKVLSEFFDEIVLVPGSTEGTCDAIDLPNVRVDTSFARFARASSRKWMRMILGLGDPELLKELASNRSLFLRHRSALRRAIGHYIQSRMAESWIRRARAGRGAPGDTVILYTWWFDAPTLGLARFGRKNAMRVVTRAHGYDLYESRHTPPYIPFREAALNQVHRVYPDSDVGAHHLISRYPAFASRIEAALLGVEDPGFRNSPSTDGVFRILSCSFLVPVKRIDLLIRGLARLGLDLPNLTVAWTHIGDGPEKANLEAEAEESLPANVRWELCGYPGKDLVYDYYRTQPVDLFVNVSESEGTPVSVIEAVSVGIPVLCTSVGGNIEVVGSRNGLLIGANPSPDEIADGIKALMKSPAELAARRAASRAVWQERYNARKNYSAFAESLQAGLVGAGRG